MHRYDQQALAIDFLELLEHFIPSDFEMKLLVNYEKDGRPLDDLTDEDRFILRFGKIPRLAQRINTLTFMGNFPETVKRLQPVSRQKHDTWSWTTFTKCTHFVSHHLQQLNSIIAASMSIKSSTKLKKILEVSETGHTLSDAAPEWMPDSHVDLPAFRSSSPSVTTWTAVREAQHTASNCRVWIL